MFVLIDPMKYRSYGLYSRMNLVLFLWELMPDMVLKRVHMLHFRMLKEWRKWMGENSKLLYQVNIDNIVYSIEFIFFSRSLYINYWWYKSFWYLWRWWNCNRSEKTRNSKICKYFRDQLCIFITIFLQKSFSESLADPEMLVCDFAKLSMPSNLHLAFQALSEFEKQYNVLPKPWDEVCKKSTVIIISYILNFLGWCWEILWISWKT